MQSCVLYSLEVRKSQFDSNSSPSIPQLYVQNIPEFYVQNIPQLCVQNIPQLYVQNKFLWTVY